MIRLLIDNLKGSVIIAFLIYSIFITVISKGLYDERERLQETIVQTEKELQTQRRLRRIDGEAFQKLQTQKKQLESQRGRSADVIGGLTDHEKSIIYTNIPDPIRRLLNNE